MTTVRNVQDIKIVTNTDQEKSRSIFNFFFFASIFVAVGYFIVGFLVLFDPAEAQRGPEFYDTLRHHAFIPMTWRLIFVAVSIMTIPCITAITRYVRSKSTEMEGFFNFILIMGYAGAILNSLEWMREYFTVKAMLHYFPQGNDMYNAALEVASLPLDPDFIWKFGGLGLWYVLVNGLAHKHKMMPKWITISGIGVGLSLIAALIFFFTDTIVHIGEIQFVIAQVPSFLAGFVFAPIFHIGAALYFRKHLVKKAQAKAAAKAEANA